MKRFVKGQCGQILVALQFDALSDLLLDSAADLAKRLRTGVRLVHVCEPFFSSNWSTMVAGELAMAEVAQTIEEEAVRTSEERIKVYADKLAQRGIASTHKVLVGKAADLIIADAVANHASMIVSGASSSHRFVPKGLSTSLSLMGYSPIPVLILTSNEANPFRNEKIRFVVCDDLREGSDGAVIGAVDLATSLNKSSLCHVHVNGLTLNALKSTLETSLAMAHSSLDPATSAADIFAMTQKLLEKKLNERAPQARNAIEAAGGEYNVELASGVVADEVERVVDKWKADVIVFGRHQTFHRKPFLIGQMPFHAMISQKRPIIVLPSAQG